MRTENPGIFVRVEKALYSIKVKGYSFAVQCIPDQSVPLKIQMYTINYFNFILNKILQLPKLIHHQSVWLKLEKEDLFVCSPFLFTADLPLVATQQRQQKISDVPCTLFRGIVIPHINKLFNIFVAGNILSRNIPSQQHQLLISIY